MQAAVSGTRSSMEEGSWSARVLSARASITFVGRTTRKKMTHGEPRTNLHPTAIKEFEIENELYDHNWPFRCPECDLPFKSARGIKLYCTEVQGHPGRQRNERAQDWVAARSASNHLLWSQRPWKCVQIRLPGVRLRSGRASVLWYQGTYRWGDVALRQARPPVWFTWSWTWTMTQDQGFYSIRQ